MHWRDSVQDIRQRANGLQKRAVQMLEADPYDLENSRQAAAALRGRALTLFKQAGELEAFYMGQEREVPDRKKASGK